MARDRVRSWKRACSQRCVEGIQVARLEIVMAGDDPHGTSQAIHPLPHQLVSGVVP